MNTGSEQEKQRRRERAEWLSGLRVGDEIAFTSGSDRRVEILRISEVGRRQILRFKRDDGRLISEYSTIRDTWRDRVSFDRRSVIEPVTPALREQHSREHAIDRLLGLNRAYLNDLPTSNLTAAARALRRLE